MMQTVEAMARTWAEWMAPMAVQVSVLFVAVAIVAWLARKGSARLRHALWCLVVLKLVVPPALLTVAGLGGWLPVTVPEPPLWQVPSTAEAEPAAAPAADAVVSAGLTTAPAPLPAARPHIPMHVWLFTVWLCGAVAFLALVAARGRGVCQRGKLAPVDAPDVLLAFDKAKAQVGMRRRVSLLLAPGLRSPVACGVLRHAVLLPADLVGRMPVEQLRPVLLHELAHIARGDVWLNWLQIALQTVYWFHPLVWLAMARLRRERELVVDDIVVGHLAGDGSLYGESLVSVLKGTSGRALTVATHVGVIEEGRGVGQRLLRILDRTRRVPSRLGWPSAVLVGALALVFVPHYLPSAARDAGAADLMQFSGGRLSDYAVAMAPDGAAGEAGLAPFDANPDHTVRGRVLDTDGHPLEGVRVGLVHAYGAGPMMTPTALRLAGYAQTLTGEDGSFEIPARQYGKEMTADRVLVIDEANGLAAAVDVPVADGGVPVDIVAKPGSYLAGTVVDTDGQPLAGAVVKVSLSPTGQGIGSELDGAVTDEAGRYVIGPVPVGAKCRLSMGAPYYDMAVGAEPEVTELEGGKSVEVAPIVIDPDGRSLSGLLVDDQGRAVGGATVGCVACGEAFTGDADGRFTIDGLPATGLVWIVALEPGSGLCVAVELDPDQPVEPLVLGRPGAVTCRALWEDGQPARGLDLYTAPTFRTDLEGGGISFRAAPPWATDILHRASGTWPYEPSATDERGVWTSPTFLVPGATYTLQEHTSGHSRLQHDFVAKGGTTVELGDLTAEGTGN